MEVFHDATGAPCAGRCKRRRRSALALVCAAAILRVAAAAETEPLEGFAFAAAQSVIWDDNVFHLPGRSDPATVGGESRGDWISRTALGMRFEHSYSLQRIAAALNLVERRYAENTRLDSSATSGSLRWDWAVGSRWSGVAVLLQREAPRSLSDVDRRIRSVNTVRRAGFEGNYWWHPDWSTVVGAEHTESRYSDRPSAGAEYDETAIEAGVGFRPASGNQLALVLREAQGDYPNRTPSLTVDSGYTQHELRLRGNWAPTGHSRFSGFVGYTSRRYDNVSRLDFSGPTARLVYDWMPTDKLSLATTLRSELGSEHEVIDNYVLTRGIAFAPQWKATDKITVRGYLEWAWRDFGSTRLASVDEDRRRTLGLSVAWEPLRTLSVLVSVQRTSRAAPGSRFDYTANVLGLDLSLAL